MNKLLFLPFFASEKSLTVSFSNPEIRFETIQRVLHTASDMLTHGLGGFKRGAGDQYFRKRLMPPGRSLIRGRTGDAEPG